MLHHLVAADDVGVFIRYLATKRTFQKSGYTSSYKILPRDPGQGQRIETMHHQALSRFIPAILLVLSALAAQLQGQPFLSDGLVAYYPLDGDATDASGHRIHGVVHNVLPTTDRNGRPSSAMSFHAQSLSSVDLGAPVSLQFGGDFTVSAWFAFSGGVIDPRIVSYGADCGYELFISNTEAERIFAVSLACRKSRDSTVKSSNTWHFVALRRSGNTAQFYINGSFMGDLNIVVPNAPTYSGNAFLGRKSILDPGDLRTYWEGAMDEVRFYNRALSNFELNQLYAYDPSCLPRRAVATPVVVNNFVVGATITDGGCGYTEPPAIMIHGGGGTGAAATATVAHGIVTGIKFSNPGRDYISDPTITIAPPPIPPRQARAISQVVNGFVVGLTVVDGGSGYDTPPAVILTGGGGNGATAVATLTDGVVTGFTITSTGSDYVTSPVVKIASPPFSPKLVVEVSRVRVILQVILGRKYLLESSTDLNTWKAIGDPFVAQDERPVQEFEVATTGRFFRISQIP